MNPSQESRERASDVLIVKLATVAVLITSVWPLPEMLTHVSPDGTVLGRYTLSYFTLLVVYCVLVAGWAVTSGWMARRLTDSHLQRSRNWLIQHAAIAVMGLGLLVSGLLALQFLLLTRAIGLPEEVLRMLRHLPPIVAGALMVAAGPMLGPALTKAIKAWKRRPVMAQLWQRRYGLALIAAAVTLAVSLVIQHGLFTHFLVKDASVHLYIGQRLLDGDVPYRDVLYFHPPLRFVVSGLWAAVARISGLPPVETARAFNVGVGVILVGVTYGIGKEATGRHFGGLAAVLLLLQMSILVELLGKKAPSLKIEIALAMAGSVWAAQRQRWFWAGVISACGVMLWLPLGVSLVGLLAAAGLSGERFNLRSFGALIVGGALVAGLAALGLSLAGVLPAAFQQTVLAAFQLGGDGVQGHKIWSQAWPTIAAVLGGWYVLGLVLLGAGLLLVTFVSSFLAHKSDGKRSAAISPVLFGMIPPVIVYAWSDRLAAGDLVVLGPMVAALASVALDWLAQITSRIRWLFPRSAEGLLLGVLAVQIGVVQFSEWRLPPPVFTLADQQAQAAELDSLLEPGQTVQSFDALWFMVMTGRGNVLPMVQSRKKAMVSNARAGWDERAIVHGLAETRPAMILAIDGSKLSLEQDLPSEYQLVRKWESSYDVATQRVWVDTEQIESP